MFRRVNENSPEGALERNEATPGETCTAIWKVDSMPRLRVKWRFFDTYWTVNVALFEAKIAHPTLFTEESLP